jgi:hypothetical protein
MSDDLVAVTVAKLRASSEPMPGGGRRVRIEFVGMGLMATVEAPDEPTAVRLAVEALVPRLAARGFEASVGELVEGVGEELRCAGAAFLPN